jgi:hypothetical protein
MLRTGEVYRGRSVLLLRIGLATWKRDVAPRDLCRKVWALKSIEWRRGVLVLVVKLFPEVPGQDYATAREIARELRGIRRTGVSIRGIRHSGVSIPGLRVMGYQGRESKSDIGRFRSKT